MFTQKYIHIRLDELRHELQLHLQSIWKWCTSVIQQLMVNSL